MPYARKERCVALNVGRLMSELDRMTVTELRRRYAEVFGEQTRSHHKDYLIRRIAWRMQANAEGDLSTRAKRVRERALAISPTEMCRSDPLASGVSGSGGGVIPGTSPKEPRTK